MKKNILITIISIICINLVLILVLPKTSPFNKKNIYLAVVLPLSGNDKSEGQAMLNGINLCLRKVNREGILKDKKIKLILIDDKKERNSALETAYRLVKENKALLVIGHYYDFNSKVAGKLYEENGIPAITASATDESITSGKSWYFRTIPNKRFIMDFTAEYISKALKESMVSIIRDVDVINDSLFSNFENKLKRLNIKIKNCWNINSEDKQIERNISTIISKLRATEYPGTILCLTDTQESAEIVTDINFPGTSNRIFGLSSLAVGAFTDNIENYSSKSFSNHYYADGVYTISPFLADVGDQNTHDFKEQYLNLYKEEPSWIAACYYDAVNIAVKAIENSELSGENIREARRALKDTLSSFNSQETAFQGVTGPIYFNHNHDVRKPLAVAVYKNNRLIPANIQYQQISDIKEDKNSIFKKGMESNVIVTDDIVMTKSSVVYVGIEIKNISRIDIKNKICTIDFYIWFSFQGYFNDSDIEFTNATKKFKLDKPVIENRQGDIITRAYHVKADFNTEFYLQSFPFDEQNLYISFCHNSMTNKKLIYVPELINNPKESIYDGLNNDQSVRLPSEWEFKNITYYQNTETKQFLSNQIKMDYSKFNALIQIKRKPLVFFVKIFMPIVVIIIFLFSIYWVPFRYIHIRIMIILFVLVITSLYYEKFLSVIFSTYMKTLIGLIYVVTIFSAVTSMTVYLLKRNEKH